MATFIKPIPTPPDWRDIPIHPLAALTDFGLGVSVEAMAAHMQNHGYDDAERIVLFEGQVFDGRTRREAAKIAEEEPTFAEFIGADPLAYIRKKALRQHLDESQRALFAAKLAQQKKQNLSVPIGTSTDAVEKAAQTFNVSKRSVYRAAKVLNEAAPEVVEAVEKGHMKVSAAAAIANEPAEAQKEIAEAAGPVLCARCKRIGRQTRDCPNCADEQEKAEKRALKRKKKASAKKAKEPKKFEWRGFIRHVVDMKAMLHWLAHDPTPPEMQAITRKLDEVVRDVQAFEGRAKT